MPWSTTVSPTTQQISMFLLIWGFSSGNWRLKTHDGRVNYLSHVHCSARLWRCHLTLSGGTAWTSGAGGGSCSWRWWSEACPASPASSSPWVGSAQLSDPEVDMKLGQRHNYHKGRAAIDTLLTNRLSFMTFASATQLHVYLLWGQCQFSIVS